MRRLGVATLLILSVAVTAASAGADPGYEQRIAGSVAVGSPHAEDVARAAWVRSGGAVNGVTGYVFRVDPATMGGEFQFEAPDRALTLRFFDDLERTTDACASYDGVHAASGRSCGSYGIVTAATGPGGAFTYLGYRTPRPLPSYPAVSAPAAPTVDADVPNIPVAPAVAYQIDAGHTGNQSDGSQQRRPLRYAWTRNLGGPVSYPVIADGRAFVTVRDGHDDEYGTYVVALDLRDGDVLWSDRFDGTYWASSLTYANGTLYLLTDGMAYGINPGRGTVLWRTYVGGDAGSAPTAHDDQIFIYTHGRATALDGATGDVVWQRNSGSGSHSSPSVDETGVYMSFACNQAYSFDRATGVQRWHHGSNCVGGGGRTTVLHGGRLYTRDFINDDLVLDAATGAELGGHDARYAPAFDTVRRYAVERDGSRVAASNSDSGTRAWTFDSDSLLTTAPLVINDAVVVGDAAGIMTWLDSRDGSVIWQGSVGAPIPPPDEHNYSQPLTGMAAGEKFLLVPTEGTLVAFTTA